MGSLLALDIPYEDLWLLLFAFSPSKKQTLPMAESSMSWSARAFWATTALLPLYLYLIWTSIEELFIGPDGPGSSLVRVMPTTEGVTAVFFELNGPTLGYALALLGCIAAIYGTLLSYWNAILGKTLRSQWRGWILQGVGLAVSFVATLFIVDLENLFG